MRIPAHPVDVPTRPIEHAPRPLPGREGCEAKKFVLMEMIGEERAVIGREPVGLCLARQIELPGQHLDPRPPERADMGSGLEEEGLRLGDGQPGR